MPRTRRPTPAAAHQWTFKARFRRHAFGWKSQPAVVRVKEAVAEIRKVARADPLLGAEGAVIFLERVSPALEQVDSSSGAIGTAVYHAVEQLVTIIAAAPADPATRDAWLERLFAAHEADRIPYIERLADHWGTLCGSAQVASAWADRLLDVTALALSPDKNVRGHYHGTAACLSALFRAGRYDELIELLHTDCIWPYKSWAVRAMIAKGERAAALRYAESCRSPWASDSEIDGLCEEVLLASGLAEEAYERYGLRANLKGTYLATFRAVQAKYPHKSAGEVLADLAASTPGDEGKWFAAAKDAGLFAEALALAGRSPCDPRTLARAARDHAEDRPDFAVGAGLLALHWIVQGHGYEIDGSDVWAAWRPTLAAAERLGQADEVKARVRELVKAAGIRAHFVARALGLAAE